MARLAEFANFEHLEPVNCFFSPEDGDLLSSILSLPAFTIKFKPKNGTIAAQLEDARTLDYPLLYCELDDSSTCFIIQGTEVFSNEFELDPLKPYFNFAYPGKTTRVVGTGYYSGNSISEDHSHVVKVGLRKLTKGGGDVYSISDRQLHPIKCFDVGHPPPSDGLWFTNFTADFAVDAEAPAGMYDVLMLYDDGSPE